MAREKDRPEDALRRELVERGLNDPAPDRDSGDQREIAELRRLAARLDAITSPSDAEIAALAATAETRDTDPVIEQAFEKLWSGKETRPQSPAGPPASTRRLLFVAAVAAVVLIGFGLWSSDPPLVLAPTIELGETEGFFAESPVRAVSRFGEFVWTAPALTHSQTFALHFENAETGQELDVSVPPALRECRWRPTDAELDQFPAVLRWGVTIRNPAGDPWEEPSFRVVAWRENRGWRLFSLVSGVGLLLLVGLGGWAGWRGANASARARGAGGGP